ncbi:anti-sigma factor [Poritiphilus flavus]|uniref:Anti-sigma factor n=1 Tax=Poritiphilus flavus TaxID=2697053 RepID=A0A6L9EA28_9FLAO|nr:anti-sigma factor [Poritiphilus flavus]NAS11625.1 anti-sigma factor [Poritiphilus flavus]
MDIEKYIASGILELYVAGELSEEENMEVFRNAQLYPKIKEEIQAIEASVLALSKTVTPNIARKKGFDDLKVRIGQRRDTTVVQLPRPKRNWSARIGWAAAVLLGAGLSWFFYENSRLQSEFDVIYKENTVLRQEIFEARSSLNSTEEIMNAFRDKDVIFTPLEGQEVAPSSYARVYWSKNEQKVYIDALGLPEPPEGKVYQVWSLTLNPLSPTSIGILDSFASDGDKIFELSNPNESQAFGITLEPEGGSDTPTMEQLYTLGQLEAS